VTVACTIVTASYAPDLERCRLLCETMDRHVEGWSHHYILVEHRDVALFRQLEGPRRTIIDERDLLPHWLHAISDPSSLFRRRIWLSMRTQPMRGWHVQQLRRIAIAAHVPEKILIYCDSDMVFLKPFDCAVFSRGDEVRLFRKDGELFEGVQFDHRDWYRNAGRALGLSGHAQTAHGYISTLIAWRSESVIDMCRHIEDLHSKHWVEVIGSARKFSECVLYGRFVDEVQGGAHHFHASEEFCRVLWYGKSPSDDEFRAFVAGMSPEQVAVGMQSFLGMDVERLRGLISKL
jgi:hypothetical protein